MRTLGPETAECLVYVYKEGLLSAAGHDLKIVVTRFTIEIEEAPLSIAARFDAASLRVVCAISGGAEDRAAISVSDSRRIERAIAEEILEAKRYPEVRFRSQTIVADGDGYQISGELALHGVMRPMVLRTRPQGPQQIGELLLHQPDFRIRPYRALLGALKIRPDVRVQLRV